MVEVTMPKMGDAMEEGTLVEWIKKEGDSVREGEPIANIQTDKATVEMESPGTGTLAGLLIQEGDTVPVGQPIALILGKGEEVPADWGAKSSVASGAKAPEPTPEPVKPAPAAVALEERPQPTSVPPPPPTPTAPTGGNGRGRRVVASPLARKLAKQLGIDLSALSGSGPGGRIIEKDVRAAAASPAAVAPAVAQTLAARDVPLTNLQRITATRTVESKQTIPHYYVTIEVDVEELQELRAWMNRENPDQKLSLNDFIIKACALALVEQPHINASYADGKRHEYGEVNIGVLAAVPDGLTLPVIHNCERKSLRQIAQEARELVEKARANRLSPNELSGATFAISNMGMFDVDSFAAVINQPNGAIVAVGTAKRVPVVLEEDGEEYFAARWRMKLTGSFDHRIIDGAVGATFMGVLRKYLESPTLLLT
jgi:pyruvate dehydrogenase E2 component (dihydrolipoamide acetyltransferase)